MKRPLPMRQDPTLPDDLRSALRAESTLPLAHDTAAVKQALMAKVAAATAAGVGTAAAVGGAKSALGGLVAKLVGGASAAKIVVGATITVVTAGVVSYTAVQLRQPAAQRPPTVDETMPAPTPSLPAPAPALPQPVPAPTPVMPSLDPPAGTALEFDPLSVRLPRSAGQPSSPRSATSPGAAPAPAAIPQPAAAARPPSLADEMAQYEAGRRALRTGRLPEAIAAFERYLEQFKDGELRPEAGLSLVEAHIKAKQPARAEAVARTLLADPTLRSRRGELLRVRAEAYVLMGRCSEAKIVYAQALSAGGTDLTRESVEAALRRCVAGQGAAR